MSCIGRVDGGEQVCSPAPPFKSAVPFIAHVHWQSVSAGSTAASRRRRRGCLISVSSVISADSVNSLNSVISANSVYSVNSEPERKRVMVVEGGRTGSQGGGGGDGALVLRHDVPGPPAPAGGGSRAAGASDSLEPRDDPK